MMGIGTGAADNMRTAKISSVPHLDNTGSEAGCARGFAGGVDCSREEVGHILQDLALGAGRVPNDGHIDVTSQANALCISTHSLPVVLKALFIVLTTRKA